MDTHHLLELSTITPLSTEKLSVGNPEMFQARILIGSPSTLLNANSLEQLIPRSLKKEKKKKKKTL